MKTLSAGLQAHLDSGNSTMAYCWKVTRADGSVEGYTEHDRDLTFGGVTYQARAGFTASQISQKLGLSVDNLDIQGGLGDDSFSEDQLATGLYDNAAVEIWWVNWQDTTESILISKGNLGEVTRGRTGFEAEFRSLSHKLQQKKGRTYMGYCDAKVGDSRCGVDLTSATYRGTGSISGINNRRFTVSGLSSFETDWFNSGIITFTSGQNNAAIYEVKRFTQSGSTAVLELWFPTPSPVSIGDTFSITAGCQKDSTTCRVKFNNIENHRGFPFMPGNDALTSYPVQGGGADGKSLFNG